MDIIKRLCKYLQCLEFQGAICQFGPVMHQIFSLVWKGVRKGPRRLHRQGGGGGGGGRL